MFVFGNFIAALATLIDLLLTAYIWVIIGRAIISWVNADPYNPIVRFLCEITDPVLNQLRRRLPFLVMGGIDLTPMAVIAAIIFLQAFLVPTLRQLAVGLA
ncbi:MAG: YggT family protein [Desulfobulbaceae bacterium]|jgi:YggT family protein|nr:YggT family protein [Desulfobulbaceae bacterium]